MEDQDLREASDSDWLLRTGAIMSTETREFKGQSWLVSRQSSTSLAALRDDDDEAFERELALERELASRRTSRRGSSVLVDDDEVTPYGSRYTSRMGSRSQSVAGRRSAAFTPGDRDPQDSYFDDAVHSISGPDFVNLDEKLEELERDTSHDDEAAVRRLVRHQNGRGSWITNVIGWPLFALEENDEDEEEDEDDSIGDATSQTGRSGWSARHFEGVSNIPEDNVPPPKTDEGAWKDAAWLLSVATKVMF